MKDVISLGIGEPDFHPQANPGGRRPLAWAGETHYTTNAGKLELRQAVSNHLKNALRGAYDPTDEF